MRALLHRNLIYVTGKGGVGKSTVAAALGLAAARAGRRTIVCEVSDQQRVSRVFAHHGVRGREIELSAGLWGLSIDPHAVLIEWLGAQLGSARLARVLTHSDAFSYFAAAAPGARELMTVTKLWELAQARRWEQGASGYDLVVVDAPSSGHGIGMLRTPRTFANIARMGPLGSQARTLQRFLTDPQGAGYVAVCLPEEMPVSETLELQRTLTDQVGVRLDAIVANGLHPRRLSTSQRRQIDAATINDDIARAMQAARAESHRVRLQEGQLARLRRSAEVPVLRLPYLFSRALSLTDVGHLSDVLERGLVRIAKIGGRGAG